MTEHDQHPVDPSAATKAVTAGRSTSGSSLAPALWASSTWQSADLADARRRATGYPKQRRDSTTSDTHPRRTLSVEIRVVAVVVERLLKSLPSGYDTLSRACGTDLSGVASDGALD